MPKPRRIKPRPAPEPDDFWNPENRASLIGMIYDGLAADADETLTGVTLITPDGDARYISKHQAKAAHRRRPT